MQPAKGKLPARRSTEPLDEFLPVPSQQKDANATQVTPKSKRRKITLELDADVDEVLLEFTADFNLSQTSVINWAIKTAIAAYREGLIEAEFKPARNRIVSAK